MPTLSLRSVFKFDGRGFQNGLKNAKRSTEKFAGDIKGLVAGAFTVGALKAGIQDALNFADRVDLLASKFRTSREEVQKLDFALKPFGKDINFLNQALGTLGQSALEALRNPEGGKADIFESFGIDKKSLEEDSPLELMLKIGDALSKFDFGGKETPLVGNLIGSEAADLVPILQRDLRGLTEEAANFGAVMEDEMIDELSAANKQIAAFGSASRVVFGKLASFLLDVGTKIKDLLDIVVGGIGAFIGAFSGTDSNVFAKLDAGAAAFEDHMNDVLDKRIAKEQAAQDAAAAAQKKREASGLDVDKLLTSEKRARERAAEEKEISKIQSEISKIQFERLSDEEKENALLEERKEILERIRKAQDTAAQERESQQKRLAQVTADLMFGGQSEDEAREIQRRFEAAQDALSIAQAQKDQEKIAAAKRTIDEIIALDREQRSRSNPSAEERVALEKERKDLIAAIGREEQVSLQAARDQLELEKNKDALAKLKGKDGQDQNVDSLARIGGFVGGAASRTQSNQEKLLKAVEKIGANVADGVEVKGA